MRVLSLFAFLSSLSALAADPVLDHVLKVSCTQILSGTIVGSGEKFPSTISRVTMNGHELRWVDATHTFSMDTFQTHIAGTGTPYLGLGEKVTGAGGLVDQTSVDFLDDGTGEVGRTVHETKWKRTDVSASEYTLTDTAKVRPVMTVDTSLLPGKVLVMVGKTKAPSPSDGVTQLNSSISTCRYAPAKFEDLKLAGFFANLKKPIAAFDASHNAVSAAQKAADACLAATPKACDKQKAALEGASAAREKLWKNLVKASDLPLSQEDALNGGSSVGSDDGDGGGGGPAQTGPFGPGNSCSGTGGGISCTNGASCSNTGGGIDCSDGTSCTNTGGGMNCSNGVSRTSTGGGMNCSNGTSCSNSGGGFNCS